MHQCIVVGTMACQTKHCHRALCSTMSSIIALKTSLSSEQKILPLFITYLNEGWAGREVVVIATVDANGMLQLLLRLLLRLLNKGR